MKWIIFAFFLSISALNLSDLRAEIEIDSDYGASAASEYFNDRGRGKSRARISGKSSSLHYMTIHFGGFLDEDNYKWGKNDGGVAKMTAGVSYRVGEWVNSMDLLFRGDVISFKLREGSAVKLSVMPMVIFPDAKSRFPLYFGGGAGLGVFFKQIPEESALSFDYQILAGGRVFDFYRGIGFNVEVGMKNHVHLLSDGQHNGVFASLGSVFNF